MGADLTEFIQEFVSEARDLIEELEPVIVGFGERDGENPSSSPDFLEDLNRTFRLFHSVKGGAGFLGFGNIVKAAHTAENLLDQLRNSQLLLAPHHTDLLCASCDFMKEALEHVMANGNDSDLAENAQKLVDAFTKPEEPTDSASAPAIDLDLPVDQLVRPHTLAHFAEESETLLNEAMETLATLKATPHDPTAFAKLQQLFQTLAGNSDFLELDDLSRLSRKIERLAGAVAAGAAPAAEQAAATIAGMIDILKENLRDVSRNESHPIDGLNLYMEMLDDLIPHDYVPETLKGAGSSRIGDILIERGDISEADVNKAVARQSKLIGELLVESGVVTEKQITRAVEIQQQRKQTPQPATNLAQRQDIRVDLEKLDSLINLIGEIVIAENMVLHNPDLTGLELENFAKAGQHLSKIIRELQEMAMTIRMIPVSGLFRRMLRLVHDLSGKAGKKVSLELVGESTEVDKTVIEKITDPLVHLIRNSVDHGLEPPAERQAAGKNETGVIHLSAYHEEGNVLITITDDGRGLNRTKIIAKAEERGLLSCDPATMSDREVFNLIFLPGFSTAEKVTDVSGRGVGMDVVRRNLEEIKGKVEIKSNAGKGTTINMRIPLTMAIIDGMLIRVGKSFYILPILSLQESFRPASDAVTVTPDGQELVRVRDHLLPVLRLHDLHRIEPDNRALDRGILIVLDSGGKNVCLFADELLGQQQTVIKGLSSYITETGNVTAVSGCTILGNGEVCLILDVQALTQLR